VAFLVRDLERAVQDYVEILNVLDPEQSQQIVWDEGLVEGFRMRWATFVKHNGSTVLQFLESELPRDRRLLEKKGECVHHLAYSSTDVAATVQRLSDAGIPLVNETLTSPAGKPWLQWNFIHPRKAHGVLIEVSSQYQVRDGKWVPADADQLED
jgi:methylmalonyl-CoA/ethylmalonyl-CoA epimerase